MHETSGKAVRKAELCVCVMMHLQILEYLFVGILSWSLPLKMVQHYILRRVEESCLWVNSR